MRFSNIQWLLSGLAVLVIVFLMGCSSKSPSSPTAIPTVTQPPTTTTVTSLPATQVTSTTPSVSPVTSSPPASTSLPASTVPGSTTASPTPPAPSASPTPTPAAPIVPFPTTLYTPAAAPYVPSGTQLDLVNYVLQLINQDRAAKNLPAVQLDYNAAAQKHAQDMLDNNYLAHWGTDGLKPYMRYTFEGGLNYEQENSAYSSSSQKIDPKTEIKDLEYKMVYDDAASNWGHRDNIWNKMHDKVSIGLAYDSNTLTMVQQFEGDYVEFYQPPTLQGSVLSLSGRFKTAGLALNNAAITYDPLPQPLTGQELMSNAAYHSYGLGPRLGQILPPPPPNSQYSSLPAGSVVASQGYAKDREFSLEADITSILAKGPGVYTVCLIALLNNQPTNFTNYSITVK